MAGKLTKAIFVCAALILLYLATADYTITHTAISAAKTDVIRLRAGLSAYKDRYGKEMQKKLMDRGDDIICNVLCGGINAPPELNPDRIVFWEKRRSQVSLTAILDPWGHPYSFSTRVDHTKMADHAYQIEIFVWSYGPDGVNQNGKGDDVK